MEGKSGHLDEVWDTQNPSFLFFSQVQNYLQLDEHINSVDCSNFSQLQHLKNLSHITPGCKSQEKR